MSFISSSCAFSSREQCSVAICITLTFLLSFTIVVASDQMPRCAELQSDSQSAYTWDYCVDERPASRNWYQAMADCRGFGGELLALEWPAKIEDIHKRLTSRGVDLSSGVFVNAHRPFYSANDRFAWRSGMEFSLEVDTDYMEQCVKFSSTGLRPITCDSFEKFPLLCQRVFPRKTDTSELQNLLLSAQRNLNVSFTSIIFAAESCDYFSFVRFDYNWYQAKKLCETINSELLGIPRIEECKLIGECLNMRLKSKIPQVFINMHLKMYARNGSFEIFRDPLGEIINVSHCVWNDKLKYTEYDAYCVVVEQGSKLSQIKCSNKDTTDLVGLIRRQCRSNSNYSYPYIRRSYLMRSTELILTETRTIAPASISKSGLRTSAHLVYIISVLVVVNVVLVVALVFSLLRNCRARMYDTAIAYEEDDINANEVRAENVGLAFSQQPLTTAFRPDSNTRLESYDCYDNEQLRDAGESDASEARTPPKPPPPPPPPQQPQPPGQTYPPPYGTRAANFNSDQNNSGPSEYVEGWAIPVGGGVEAQARLLSNSSTNESQLQLGNLQIRSTFIISYMLQHSTLLFAQMLALHTLIQ